MAGAVATALPVFCEECFKYLSMEGHDDPTQDVSLLYFVWWGKHKYGLSREER